jgi:hypothetical protein
MMVDNLDYSLCFIHTYIHAELWYKMRLDEDWDHSSMLSPVFPSYIIEVINKMCVSIHLESVLHISVMPSTWSKHSFTLLWRATEHDTLDCSFHPLTHTGWFDWWRNRRLRCLEPLLINPLVPTYNATTNTRLLRTLDMDAVISGSPTTNFQETASARNQESAIFRC